MLKVYVYGLLVPVIVWFLSLWVIGVALDIYKVFVGANYNHVMSSQHALALGMLRIFSFILLTIVYYTFCGLFYLLKRPTKRKWLIASFLIIPVFLIFLFLTSIDFRGEINYIDFMYLSMFHLTYYVLFYVFRYFLYFLEKEIQRNES